MKTMKRLKINPCKLKLEEDMAPLQAEGYCCDGDGDGMRAAQGAEISRNDVGSLLLEGPDSGMWNAVGGCREEMA